MKDKEVFFEYLKQIYLQNPNLEVSMDTIYHELCIYGLTKEEGKNNRIDYLFYYWIDRFKDDSNLNVYETERQPGFIQFASKRNEGCKCAKIYLSFSKEDMFDAVNRIFDFISFNNINSGSKVSDILRSDSVVLRIPSVKEAKMVIDFINNDQFLRTKCKKVNPFLIRDGVVGLAYDDLLSYNSTLSSLIASYFNNLKKKNNLQKASLTDLSNYIRKDILEGYFYSNRIYNDINMINKFNSDKSRYGTLENLVNNYREIFEMIDMSLNPNVKCYDYYNFLDNVIGKNETKASANNDDLYNILNSYIYYMYFEKKESIDNIIFILNTFVNDNNYAHFTRKNNYRYLFYNYLNPHKIMSLTNNNPSNYVKKYLMDVMIEGKVNKFYYILSYLYNNYGMGYMSKFITDIKFGLLNINELTLDIKNMLNGISSSELPLILDKLTTNMVNSYRNSYTSSLANGNIYYELALIIESLNKKEVLKR